MNKIVPLDLEISPESSEIILCGGPYNNFAAVEKFLAETAKIPHRFCLGDMGGFGPYPDRTIDQFRKSKVECIQGNYDHAVGFGEGDCGCGYLDPLDRRYAQLSYDYTFKNTSEANRAWLRELPPQIRLKWGEKTILLCHGSPGQVNEFVWDSETSDDKIDDWLKENRVDGICVTHSGLPWVREVSSGFWLNVGVLGRPAHEGLPRVTYGKVTKVGSKLHPALVPMNYDPAPVVEGMRSEGLPEEFCQSLLRGIWTTCYKILPPEEFKIRERVAVKTL